MSIARLVRALSEPLAIEPVMGRLLVGIARRKLAGETFRGPALHAELGIPQAEERKAQTAPPRIAVIPMYGVVAQHAQSLGVSTTEIGEMFDAAIARPDIDAVLLDVDSPGGTVGGTPEVAAKIFAARGTKPVWAIANGLAASAAYWIASAADEVWVTPSGEAGSIGVYTVHEDWSKSLEQDGVKVTPISYGKYKLEGAPWEPLSEEAKERLQASVNTAGQWFTKDVARHRGDTPANVRAGYGEGRLLSAKDALEAKLVDRIGTFEDALAALAKKAARKPRGSRAMVERERLTLDSECK